MSLPRTVGPKTKIIATLGDPEGPDGGTYTNGIFDLARRKIQPTLDNVIELLFANGVDVIRINLAHIEKTQDVATKFRAIKKAIRAAEQKHERRIGVLADLPGPKIRLQDQFVLPSEKLYVGFSSSTPPQGLQSSRNAEGIPAEWFTPVILGEQLFAQANPEATDLIFTEVRSQLQGDSQRPLAFIGDNDCTLEITEIREPHLLVCRVIAISEKVKGGRIGQKKGFAIRGITKKIGAFTDDDKAKLTKILEVDFEGDSSAERILSHVGISFCQTRDDVKEVLIHIIRFIARKRRKSYRKRDQLSQLLEEAPLLIAKIETEDGITNLDDILDLADGAMIARGDLALEVESVAIPRKSKEITEKCRLRGKPVIMATQMLESMRTNIEPSRPEATDVFNAVFDGADALMLTGETSTGKYPAHAIQKMCELAAGAEKYLHEREEPDSYISGYFRQLQSLKTRVVDWENRWTKIAEALGRAFANQEISDDDHAFLNAVGQIKQARLKQQSSTDRISHAACTMATDESVIALVVPTQSGRSARMLSRFRPQPWIIALPHSRLTARKLQIDWGVYVGDIVPIGTNKEVSWLMGMSQEVVERKLVGTGILDKGKTMIFTCGTPLGKVGTTNLVLRGEVGIPWVSQT